MGFGGGSSAQPQYVYIPPPAPPPAANPPTIANPTVQAAGRNTPTQTGKGAGFAGTDTSSGAKAVVGGPNAPTASSKLLGQ